MPPRILIPIASAVLLLVSGRLGSAAQVKDAASPPVRQVDHIMVRADDPAVLFSFLTRTLELPVAWPLATRGGVTSGAAAFGNANVEAIRFPGQTASSARLVGFGFEPAPLAEALAELDRRGVPYGAPRPFVVTEQGGSRRTLFTNVTLRQFSDADRPAGATIHIFLSEYSPDYVDVAQRRARLRRELRESGGGPLGVVAVREIIVGATDPRTAATHWGKLLEPTRQSAPGLWQVGDGPAIRVIRAGENRLQGLVIRVVSLRRAKAFLLERGLLGAVTETDAMIEPSKIAGLSIRLVEDR